MNLGKPYSESGKYKVIFSEKAKAIRPIPFSDSPPGAMLGSRYTTFEKLKATVMDLVGKK